MSQKLQSASSTFDVLVAVSPEEWITVGGVRAINDFRSGTAAEIDVSDLSSPAREIRLGVNDGGNLGVDLFFDPEDPGQILLEGLHETGEENWFRVTISNPLAGSPARTGYIFNGLIQSVPFSLAEDAAITGTITVRVMQVSRGLSIAEVLPAVELLQYSGETVAYGGDNVEY